MDPREAQRAIELLAQVVATWDHGFPPSERFSANFETTLLIADMANLVRRIREEFRTGRGHQQEEGV